ncbi:MAG: hypothetical protein WAM73_09535 [Desulfobacterales bacterium]
MNYRRYRLKIRLRDIESEIRRRFVVPVDITLDRLHEIPSAPAVSIVPVGGQRSVEPVFERDQAARDAMDGGACLSWKRLIFPVAVFVTGPQR